MRSLGSSSIDIHEAGRYNFLNRQHIASELVNKTTCVYANGIIMVGVYFGFASSLDQRSWM